MEIQSQPWASFWSQTFIIDPSNEEPAIAYTLPGVVQEISMADPGPLPVHGSFALSYQKMETGSEHGKVKLIDSYGYTYTVKRKYTHSTEWQCTFRNKKVKF